MIDPRNNVFNERRDVNPFNEGTLINSRRLFFQNHKTSNDTLSRLLNCKPKENKIFQFFIENKMNISELFRDMEFDIESIYEKTYKLTSFLLVLSNFNSSISTNILLEIISNTEFFENQINYCLTNGAIDEKYLIFVSDVVDLLNNIAKIVHGDDDNENNIKNKLNKLNLIDVSLKLKSNLAGNEQNKNLLQNLHQIQGLVRKIEEINIFISQSNDFYSVSGQKYKQFPIILQNNDFTKPHKIQLFPHKKFGNYNSPESYIETLFKLEYEDCYKSIRTSINNLYNEEFSINEMDKNRIKTFEKYNKDIYVYTEGIILSIEPKKAGIILTMDFYAPYHKIIGFKKRMKKNSLVILVDDDFKNFIPTVVYRNYYTDDDRKNLNVPKFPRYRVELSLLNYENFNYLIKNKIKWQLFESKSYFESHIHFIKRLQSFHTNSIPFKEELIDCKLSNLKIEEITSKQFYTYNDMNLDYKKHEYPTEFKNKLDNSQLAAVDSALNNKIALIQGPPGTGKTYVGSLILDIFSKNTENDEKILLVCHTNHAIDQFIEKILTINNKIDLVRIGGRCSNEKIKPFVFNNTEKKSELYSKTNYEIKNICEELGEITSLYNINERLDIDLVRDFYQDIYVKIYMDFLYLIYKKVSYYIVKKSYCVNEDEFKIRNKKLTNSQNFARKLFKFWNKIGDKDNRADSILILFVDGLHTIDDKEKKNYKHILINYFKFYDKDNIELLKELGIKNNNDYKYLNINEKSNKNLTDNIIDANDDYSQDNDNNEEEESESEISTSNEKEQRKKYDEELIELSSSLLTDEQLKKLLSKKCNNFFRIGPKLVKLIIEKMKHSILLKTYENREINNLLTELKSKIEYKNEISLLSEIQKIRNYKIIATTTTYAAKCSSLFDLLNIKKVIIEEAGEVLESHIMSLLSKSINQLIMIGDHKQLRPKPYLNELCTKYNYDISMFERLINNNINYVCLKYQRRMRPIFADFTRIFYGKQDYIDHEDVKNREHVKGMSNDISFITHNYPEEEIPGIQSKKNEYEAKYLICLCKYLLQQNYTPPKQITILTFYVGQYFTILKYLNENEKIKKNVHVSTVDNFQGEESDIVLLSLVRSNYNNDIGFLSTFNRVCVAFSRAKYGFYIIGNIDSIIQGEKKINIKKYSITGAWQQLKNIALEKKIISNNLILKCQNHNKETIIKSYEDFGKCPEGGCQQICNKERICKHPCKIKCHNLPCEFYKCCYPCNKNCKLNLHKCPKLCWEECGKCEVKVTKILPCGHEKENCFCYENENLIYCNKIVEKKLPCGHIVKDECSKPVNEILCQEITDKKLPCGHIKKDICSKNGYEIECKEKCTAILKCGHQCTGTCDTCLKGTLHKKCIKKCKNKLDCGHFCQKACKCDHKCLCMEKCEVSCPHGKCNKYCFEICEECEKNCVIECVHSKCNKKCYELCDRKPCNERCSKILKCSHQCVGLCGERCPKCKICFEKEHPDEDYYEIFYNNENDPNALFYQTECGHIIEVSFLDELIKQMDLKGERATCPYCKQVLKWEPRYQNIIKKLEEKVRYSNFKYSSIENNFGYIQQYFRLSEEIVNDILDNQFKKNKISIFEKENIKSYDNKELIKKIPIIYDLCKNKFSMSDIYSKLETTYLLLKLANDFMGIEYFANSIKENNKEIEKSFIENYSVIKTYFENGFKSLFNKYFYSQLENKINNMVRYVKLKLKGEGDENIIVKLIKKNYFSDNQPNSD